MTHFLVHIAALPKITPNNNNPITAFFVKLVDILLSLAIIGSIAAIIYGLGSLAGAARFKRQGGVALPVTMIVLGIAALSGLVAIDAFIDKFTSVFGLG
jgi:hypothetical protein